MTQPKMKKKNVIVTEDVATVIEAQENQSEFMRHAIEKEVARKQKGKTELTIDVKFAGAGYYDTIRIITHATGKLKEKIAPLMDAIETLQEVILYLDP